MVVFSAYEYIKDGVLQLSMTFYAIYWTDVEEIDIAVLLNGMNVVFGSILHYMTTGPDTTWANEMNFDMNHTPGAGSIARPVVL